MQKTINTLLAILFFTSLLSAQQLQASWNNQKGSISDEVRFAGSIAWYAPQQKISGILLRMDYMKFKETEYRLTLNTHLLQIDVAQRWYTLLSQRIKAYAELGISTMTGWAHYNEEVIPVAITDYNSPPPIIGIFPYPVTAPDPFWIIEGESEEVVMLVAYSDDGVSGKKTHQLQTLPGILYGSGAEIAIGKQCYLGVHLTAKYYFNFVEQKQMLFLVYGSHIGFRF